MVSAASSALSPYEGEHDLSFVLQREIPWYWSRFTAAQMSQLTLRSPFLDNDLVDMLYRAPAAGFDGSKFELEAIGQNRRELLNVRTNQGAGGTAPHWISSIIHRFVKLRILSEKALLWDTLPRSLHHTVTKVDTLILSPLRLNRLLIGFEYYRQYNLWFRRELVSYVKEVALDSRTLSRPYWDAKAVRRIVYAHIRGRGRYLSEIRKVLTIELIHRLLVEGRG
jgi:asparagine synthase (glutamine-hydrolysing)